MSVSKGLSGLLPVCLGGVFFVSWFNVDLIALCHAGGNHLQGEISNDAYTSGTSGSVEEVLYVVASKVPLRKGMYQMPTCCARRSAPLAARVYRLLLGG